MANTMPKWDKRTQPPLREWLIDLALGEPGRTAVRSLISMADDAELEQRYRDPMFWADLAYRWLNADSDRRADTARSYLSRARVKQNSQFDKLSKFPISEEQA